MEGFQFLYASIKWDTLSSVGAADEMRGTKVFKKDQQEMNLGRLRKFFRSHSVSEQLYPINIESWERDFTAKTDNHFRRIDEIFSSGDP